MITRLIGADLGNDALKLVLGADERVHLSNAVKQVPLGEVRGSLSDDEEEVMDSLDVFVESSPWPTLNNRRFYVGELAVKNKALEIGTARKKKDNPYLIVPLLTALALQAQNPMDEIRYYAVVGLPVAEYRSKEVREEYQHKLQGKYVVKFMNTPGRAGWQVTINLNVFIVPEGVSVVYNQILDNEGNMVRPEWQNQTMGVIDVGAFTTDIPVINDKGKPDADLSNGFEIGISTALDSLRKEIEKKEAVKLSRPQLVEAITKKGFYIQNGSKTVSVEELAKARLEALAIEIKEAVNGIINQPRGNEIRRFLVCGGGSILLKKYLIQLEEETAVEYVWLTDNAVFQNAEGYWKLAKDVFREEAVVNQSK